MTPEVLVTIGSSDTDLGTVVVAVGLDRNCRTYLATVQVNATGVSPKGTHPECSARVQLTSGRARALSAALLVAAELLDREAMR